MNNPFFEKPILNFPYEYPKMYWELDAQGSLETHEYDIRLTVLIN